MKIQRGLAVLAVGLATFVGGCTWSSEGPPATTTPTTTSSTTTTSAAVPTPQVPAGAQQPTADGAVAFFRHFVAVYNYTYAALDPSPIREISGPDCKFCSTAAENAERAKQQGITNHGGGLTVTTAISAPGKPESGLIINANVDQEAGRSVAHDGSIISTLPRSKNVRIDARLLWSDGRWTIAAVDVNPEKPK